MTGFCSVYIVYSYVLVCLYYSTAKMTVATAVIIIIRICSRQQLHSDSFFLRSKKECRAGRMTSSIVNTTNDVPQTPSCDWMLRFDFGLDRSERSFVYYPPYCTQLGKRYCVIPYLSESVSNHSDVEEQIFLCTNKHYYEPY